MNQYDTLSLTAQLYRSMGFDKCIMTWIHHYNFIQNSFNTLKKIPFSSPINPSPPSAENH